MYILLALLFVTIAASQLFMVRKHKKEKQKREYFERIARIEKKHQEAMIAKYGW